jgi:hypothetical protein
MAYLRFSKIALVLLALSASLSAQTVVRAGTQGTAWATATLCPNGSFVTATPDNLHVFKAIQAGTGTTGATQPVWNTISGLQTTDGTCLWKEAGPSGLGGTGVSPGGSPPGGPLNSVQLNNTPNFNGSQALTFDPNTLDFSLAAIAPATSSTTTDSPIFHIKSNYWNGSASVPDDWSLKTQVRPLNGGNAARTSLFLTHTGTSGNTNGSNYNILITGDGTGATCGHEDVTFFTTNALTCLALGGSNAVGSAADFALNNNSNTGSARTRFIQSSGNVFALAHYLENDPNNNLSAQWGMNGCVPLNCSGYFMFDWTGPELYLGGNAFNPAQAALRLDTTVSGFSLRRGITAYAPIDFDPTAVTTYLLSAKELTAPATPAATFEKLYFEATYGACAKDSTGRERCTGGSPTAGTYVLTGSFGACGAPPLGSQSALCFGPSGNIQGSYAGDAFDTFLRASSYSATGLLCCVGLSQVDLSAFDARYVPINAVSPGVLPEGGVAGAGLQDSPCDDGVFASGFVRCNTNFVAGAGIPTDATTALGLLMKLSAGKMVKIGTGDTNIPVFLCTNSCGSTTANTYPLVAGIGSASFDGATVAGDYVGASPTVAGDVTDLGATLASIASNKCVIGQVLTTNGGAGTYSVQVESSCLLNSSAGSISAATNHGAMYATAATTGTSTAALSNGQILIGDTGNVPQAATITAGANITVTNAAHSITIAASGGGSGCTGATGYTFSPGVTAGPNITNNATKIWSVLLPCQISTVAKVQIDVTTAATGSDTYGVGFYDVTGALTGCNTSNTATNLGIAATGEKVITISSCTLAAGQYYFAITGAIAGTALVLGGNVTTPTNRCGVNPDTGSATTSGVLNNSITVTTFTPTTCTFPQLEISQ